MILMYVPMPVRRDPPRNAGCPYEWQVASPSLASTLQVSVPECLRSWQRLRRACGRPIEIAKFQSLTCPEYRPRRRRNHGDNWKKKRVEEDLKRICQYELKLMAELHSNATRSFSTLAKEPAGCMEHANSTAIGVHSDEYCRVSGARILSSVECEAHPASLAGSVDFTKEHTRALLVCRRRHEQYGSYTLVRSGIWTKEQFYADLGEQITELEGARQIAGRARSIQLDAAGKISSLQSTEFSVSYYTKGSAGRLARHSHSRPHGNAKSLTMSCA